MSERLAQILAKYQQVINAAQLAAAQDLIDANPDLTDELLKHFESTGEQSIADTANLGKPHSDTVSYTPEPRKAGQVHGKETTHASSRFGDYELLEEIDRGGMGVVYKARQTKTDRIIALKMILAGRLADEGEVRRFHSEAKAAANLDHARIVPVFDAGEIAGQHYFSMGYVEGGSLSENSRMDHSHRELPWNFVCFSRPNAWTTGAFAKVDR